MASSALNLLLSVVLFPVAVAGFDCYTYGDSYHCNTISNFAIILIILGVGSVFILLICCCCCPCCCLYNVCRKPRPVAGVTTTTVVNTQCVMQQPVVQGAQYPTYQPVPTQPGYGAQPVYGGQPIPPTQYQGQPYVPGPPPPYHTVVGPGCPSTQDMYRVHTPVHTPAQAGYATAPPPADMFTQPAYNPAYVHSPDAGY